jgi:glutaredoxin 3
MNKCSPHAAKGATSRETLPQTAASPDSAQPCNLSIHMNNLPVLYIKPGCPWCDEVVAFLDEHGIPYHQVDINQDPAEAEAMRKLSGQTKAPTLDWHGRILADFGVDELVPFLQAREVKLEDS